MEKEEFIIENAKLAHANKEWSDADRQKRKALSEMLNALYKNREQYDYSRERVIYSWPKIYFSLGKLVAKKDYAEFSEQINKHEQDISDLLMWRSEKKDQLL